MVHGDRSHRDIKRLSRGPPSRSSTPERKRRSSPAHYNGGRRGQRNTSSIDSQERVSRKENAEEVGDD